MNTLESHQTTSPFGEEEECAKFGITDALYAFVLHDISVKDQQYTFSCWVKSESAGQLSVGGTDFATSDTWAKYSVSFIADSEDVDIYFDVAGTYYIYHPQLEIGNQATDWTPAPEDTASTLDGAMSSMRDEIDDAEERVSAAEARLEVLANAISMLVTDGNGGSLMTQTEDGWTFNISQLTGTLDDATADIAQLTEDMGGVENTVNALQQAVTDVGIVTEYVRITTYDGQPCIELGESDSNFKLRITNTQIQFMEGSAIPAYISNQKLNIEKAEIKNELQFGNFVWKVRDNGNMGLMWKGGST